MIVICMIILIVGLYGLSQSSFKCSDILRAVKYPRQAEQQIISCRTFSDLGGYRVDITEADKVAFLEEMASLERTVVEEDVEKYLFGRAKIQEYASQNNITVSEAELDKEIEKVSKEAQRDVGDQREYIRGFILQRKVEEHAVAFIIADYVALRWDIFKPEIWQPKKDELSLEATKSLTKVQESMKKGTEFDEAVKSGEVDELKFGFNKAINQRFTYSGEEASKIYNDATKLQEGVSEIFCEDRFCVVFNVTKSTGGTYNTMDEFMEGLLGW